MGENKNKAYFGYKDHIKADEKTKLITKYVVTPANVSDKDIIDHLTSEQEDGNRPLFADSAYRSAEIESMCTGKKIISMIHQKGYKNKKLSEEERLHNHRKSKIRARIEHIFGFMTNTMNGIYLRYRNFIRNAAGIGLINITYNLFRLVQLRKKLAR